MAELMIHRLDPLPLGVVLAALLPVFGVHEVDLAVLVTPAPDASPVEVLEPLHAGTAQVIEAAQAPDRAPELVLPMVAKEGRELAVYGAALPHAGKDHAHRFARLGCARAPVPPAGVCRGAGDVRRVQSGVNAARRH